MLKVTINATGATLEDVTDALKEALRKIEDDYTAGYDSNSFSDYSFEVTGEEDKSIEILGYYIDANEEPSPSTVFVAIETPDEISSYCPIGQHSDLDLAYLNECKRITKEEYLRYSNGFYTPSDYLQREN